MIIQCCWFSSFASMKHSEISSNTLTVGDLTPNPHHPIWADSTGSPLPGGLLLPIKVSSDEAFKTHTCQVWETCISGLRPSNLIPRRGPRTLPTEAYDLDQLKALNPGLGRRKDAVDCESPGIQERDRCLETSLKGKIEAGKKEGRVQSFFVYHAG